MKYTLLILCLLFPLTCLADIYKIVDANGNVTYTDKPTSNNAVPVTIPKGNTAPATPSADTSPDSSANTMPVSDTTLNSKQAYTKFSISSPADQESIQNQPMLSVKLDVMPALQEGDVIQVYVDGGPIGNAMHQTSFDFTTPYRGTHILSATLFDKDMKVLKRSNTITIFVHQAHTGPIAS